MDQFHNELEQDIEFYNILLIGYLKFKDKVKSSSEEKSEDTDDKEIQKTAHTPSGDETQETKTEADQSDGNGSIDNPAERIEQKTASQVFMINECR